MKTRFSLMALCGALTCFDPVSAQSASLTPADPPKMNPTQTLAAASAPATELSPGLDEIVTLTKAATPEPVILSFIRGSRYAYHLTSQDILRLRKLGVSGKVTTALLQQGNEIRQLLLEQKTRAAASATPSTNRIAPATRATNGSIQVYVTPLQPTRIHDDTRYSDTVYVHPGYYPRYYRPVIYPFAPRAYWGLNFGGGFRDDFRGGFGGGFRHR
jgi:hypothetical protein